jgi:Holliday junction DNA helicase RuvA
VIARLRGRLDGIAGDHAVIDVGGVGYLVLCSARTLAALPGVGQAVDLHVETQLRAESIALYGFKEPAERVWFRLLQTVQGVGARVALGLLSVLAPDELARAVAAQDKAALSRASGVGPRLAGRIASELRERLVDLPLPGTMTGAAFEAAPRVGTGPAADAVSALVNLGYGRSEAHAAIAKAAATLGEQAAADALIRTGLQELAGS